MSELQTCSVCLEDKQATKFYKGREECMKCSRAIKNDELSLTSNKEETVLDVLKTPTRGVGDLIEKFTKVTHLDKLVGDDCGCDQKKDKANAKFPFKRKTRKCLEGADLLFVKNYAENWKNQHRLLHAGDAKEIYRINTYVYATRFDPHYCSGCNGSRIKSMLQDLLDVYGSM